MAELTCVQVFDCCFRIDSIIAITAEGVPGIGPYLGYSGRLKLQPRLETFRRLQHEYIPVLDSEDSENI